MANKKISELVEATSINNSDELVIVQNGATKKVKAENAINGKITNLQNQISELDSKVNITDIVDNLTTADTTKVLSAKQGKNLKDNYTQQDITTNSNAVKCGFKINGYDVYEKILSFTDAINANVLFTKAHNIPYYNKIWINAGNTAFASYATGVVSYPLPMIGYNGNLTDKVYCYLNENNICIFSNTGWGSIWTKQIAIRYY